MVFFTPPAVVYVVFVVTGARYGRFEEVGVGEYRGCRHEATARVAVDSHARYVHVGTAHGELFGHVFLVGQSVVAQVSVAVGVIPLGAVGVAAAVTHGHHYES